MSHKKYSMSITEELKKELFRSVNIRVDFFEKLEKIINYLNRNSKDNKKYIPEKILEEIIDNCYHHFFKKEEVI